MRDHRQHPRGRPQVDRLKPFAESAMSPQPASDPLPDVLPFPKHFSLTTAPDPRINNPGVTHSRQNSRSRSQAASGQETLWATELDPEIKALAQAAEQVFRDPIVLEESRQQMGFVLLSHADQDHISGLLQLLASNEIEIDRVRLNTDSAKQSKLWKNLVYELELQESLGIFNWDVQLTVDSGESLSVGSVDFDVLAPGKALAALGPGQITLLTAAFCSAA